MYLVQFWYNLTTLIARFHKAQSGSMRKVDHQVKVLSETAYYNRIITRYLIVFLATILSTSVVTTPTTTYDFTKGVNTTVTIRLNTPFNSKFSNKSSSSYKSFTNAITDGLKIAYEDLMGFQGVFVEELICHEEVAVKHKVVTSSQPNIKVIEARLILANVTSGYLKGKVVEANRLCKDEHDEHDHDDHDDSTNWVYMIVFVCITALLLLAMVCSYKVSQKSLPFP